MSMGGAIVRGISWVGLGHAVTQVCWFGSLLVLAAYVAPAVFGAVAIAMVAVQVAWLVVGSGTRGTFVVAPSLTRRQVVRAVELNLAVGAAVGLAALAAPAAVLDVLAPGAPPDVVRALACSVALFAASIVPLALLQRAMRFKRYALASAGAALVASAGSIVAVVLGAGVWALVGRQVAFQAVLAALAWGFAHGLVPARGGADERAARPPGAGAFFALAVIAFAAINVDTVVIAHLADSEALGLYALAFTIAFAPMTQVAWQVGKVLFPAAARSERALLGPRARQALGVAAIVVASFAPVAVMLAPALVPTVLGERWRGMVVVLQLLIVAGAAHAVLAILREFLLGAGAVRTCLRIEAVWLAATMLALVPAVTLAGITGAALVHLALVVPVAAAYARWGMAPIGVAPRELWHALRPAALAAGLEGGAAAAGLLIAGSAGLDTTARWVAGAAAAAVAGAALCATLGRGALADGLAKLRAARVAGGVA